MSHTAFACASRNLYIHSIIFVNIRGRVNTGHVCLSCGPAVRAVSAARDTRGHGRGLEIVIYR